MAEGHELVGGRDLQKRRVKLLGAWVRVWRNWAISCSREGRALVGHRAQGDGGIGQDQLAVFVCDALRVGDALGNVPRQLGLLLPFSPDADFAPRLEFDVLGFEGPVIDADVVAGLGQMFVGGLGPGLAPLSKSALAFQDRTFGPKPSWVTSRMVRSTWACGLLGSSSWIEKSATMPLETKWVFR